MIRPTTSLTVAIWSAVLGCCVCGVNVSQAAAAVSEAQQCINAEESRDNNRQTEFNRAMASLAYWSDLLQTQTSELGKLSLHPATDTLVWNEELRCTGSRSIWLVSVADTQTTFAATRTRWSLGFH